MTEWQPSTFEGFLRKVNKALAKSDRVSVGAANKADDAQSTANVAAQQAVAAQAAATNAVTAANGKNTVKFRAVAPTTSAGDAGGADGDLWFVIPNVQTGSITG